MTTPTPTHPTPPPALHVAEYTDDLGVYCIVRQGEEPAGNDAEYANLEEAAWAIAQHTVKSGEQVQVVIHGDDRQFGRFNRAQVEATRHYQSLARQSTAPRDKLTTGRPLFVAG